ncbi:threonine/serine dehydratase [Hyphococcus flavus]|uniref:Threonine/serine dehydratase n=1 Tax=Hyphococcus flavus TaxID=1866326 RepID=A0AAF0CFW0_9PROT|nr:threonine/serine dehydratase [Hyphococcus flavus]WDI31769.1 threonine/serine dehydratase [Hyphococcus flavus]
MSSIKSEEITVSAEGVRAAAIRLKGKAVRTPLIENEILNERAGGRVFLKAEVLQRYGSFKFRGAYNLISQLTDEQRKNGVLAWSSGNHAQGVALASRLVGAKATIVMPDDAPEIKARNVRALGADIVSYDRYKEDREAIAMTIVRERNMALAPSYDHPHIVEGQGTLALETYEDAAELGVTLDAFIACCGGGGLTSGCATILEEVSPETAVWIAEPEGYDEAWASIQAGERLQADVTKPTICDAIATPSPGWLTFPILQRLVRGGVTITEHEVRDAMMFAYEHLKLVVEPGGAVALAAILSQKFDSKGKATAVTLSGGNVDPSLFASVLRNRA